MNWLNKLQRKFGRYYIHDLMKFITVGSLAVFVITYVLGPNLYYMLRLDPSRVMKGEIWRLITFVIAMPPSSILSLFMLYFYYMAGNALERVWGGFKFNVYYLVGVLATIIVSFLTGIPATGSFVNLSLFLAYAKFYPDTEMLVMFILPIKIKYLAYINWAIIILEAVSYVMKGEVLGVLLALVPVVNYLLFFSRSNYREAKTRTGSVIRLKDYQKKVKSAQKPYMHKCEVCGITDVDDPDMEFRYCSKCTGKKGYCEKHIHNHEHK